ncbi:ethanolamine ammonia-lyase subunit EutC [Solimonas terrae]|uniref:Ethanolamine ammonia-lyase small subunit n=1 Tax=Solimonas terrae TaxID=1396819 RepID=A0A6M2BXC2_9GAMM|nr:ethanolamine ammonia-lyase subunit EutC [Solimonas terrae]NGY06517.1 ethanolamine ammonia-lyase subunit EutC [Solimonas terrae]
MSDERAIDSARDPFARLRQATRARIALGRAGDALPTRALLDFQLGHSRARDAVHGAVDFDAIAERLPTPSLRIRSQVRDRAEYLRRPDLGRRVHADDLAMFAAGRGAFDLAFVIADGLSAAAVNAHAVALIDACWPRLHGWRLAPLVLGEQARVAFGDEVGAALGARIVAVLIGERPGLSVADSLGVYLTWDPKVGRSDAERNCISNIHADGLSPARAADTLIGLLTAVRRIEGSGVAVKADTAALASLSRGD